MNISRNIFMMCYFLSKRLRVTLRVGQNRILKIDPDFLWTLIMNHIPVLKGGMIGILENKIYGTIKPSPFHTIRFDGEGFMVI